MRLFTFFLAWIGTLLIVFIIIIWNARPISDNNLVCNNDSLYVELEKRICKLQDKVDYLEYEIERYSNIWAVLTRNEVGIY